MVVRAKQLWQEAETRWNRKLLFPTGALWMVGTQDEYEKTSLPLLEEAGVAFDTLTPAEAARHYPQINFEGVKWALYERDAGYLLARQACQAVLEGFREEGGDYRQVSVTPGPIAGGEMRGLKLSDESELVADHYVFACGPWLGKLFPELLGNLIEPTRQEVFFFGPPAGDARFLEDSLPVWIDNGERLFYGIPANQGRGFKLADDTRGPRFDPTAGERVPTPQALQAARDYLQFRFPRLKEAPLLEARVCQYENTPDHHFILDRHPQAANVWLVGGGSGHGFKHGPALGELIARVVLEHEPAPAFFSLARF
jgi:glycine/D-amino acid oxidase-like deaminating enzyme